MEKQIIPGTVETEIVKIKRNRERYMALTGKSEADYEAWASEVGRKMHINNLDRIICAKMGIYQVGHLVCVPTPIPEKMPESDTADFLIEHSENPFELSELWRKTRVEATYWHDKESVVASMLTCFPKSDFEQHGDRNHLPDVSRAWFKADGLNLDIQAMEMSENSGLTIEIQDIIDFVMKWRPRGYKNPAELKLKRIEARFKEVTTFSIKDYYAEHLMKMCCFFEKLSEEVPF